MYVFKKASWLPYKPQQQVIQKLILKRCQKVLEIRVEQNEDNVWKPNWLISLFCLLSIISIIADSQNMDVIGCSYKYIIYVDIMIPILFLASYNMWFLSFVASYSL